MHATEVLRDIPLFKTLSDAGLSKLEARTSVRRVEEGETYIASGDAQKAFAVVLAGQFKVYRVNDAGKEQIFAYARPGEVLGIGPITDPYRTAYANCTARVATEVAEIDYASLREVIASEPRFAVAMLNEQSVRLSQMVKLVDQLSLKDAHNRLALWLDQWISENHPDAVDDEELLVILPYTQSEIAAQIGTVREVVSRGFSRMEKDKIIHASGKRVTVINRAGLRKMASQ